jgi:hypothetical protein
MERDQTVLELFRKGHEAADKFDYFVCTVAGAIFAYDAEHYVPRRLDFSFHSLESVSLLLLALAFYCGLKRIEASRTVTQLNHGLVDCEDKAKQLALLILDPTATRHISGQISDKSNLDQERQKYLKYAKANETNIPKFVRKATRHQKMRDIFLLCGFVAIFLAKVLQPYGADVSAAATATVPPAQIQSPSAHLSGSPIASQPAPANFQTNKTSQ